MLKLRFCAVALCLISLTSCREVILTQSVPAKADSVVDTRLIGVWKFVYEDESSIINLPSIVVVGRTEKSKTTMDYILFDIPRISKKKKLSEQQKTQESELHLVQGVLYLHRGKIDILGYSMLFYAQKNGVDTKLNKQHLSMFRYEFKDSNLVHLYRLDFDHIGNAIASKKLGGKLEREQILDGSVDQESNKKVGVTRSKDKNNNGVFKSVVLDDDPKKIIRYLESHPEAFEKKPLVFKRVTVQLLEKVNH